MQQIKPNEGIIPHASPTFLSEETGPAAVLAGSRGLPGRALRWIALTVLPAVHRLFLGVRIQGKENLNGIDKAVSICNHVHYLDCAIVACTLKWRTVLFPTLSSNFEIPVVRHIIRLLGALPIPGRPDAFREFWELLLSELREGRTVHFFPEGSMKPYARGLRNMKNGAFCLAYDAGVPILPFMITYREPKGILKKLKKRPYLTCTILPPIWPDKEKEKREEVNRMREICKSAMKEIGEEHELKN